MKFTELVEEFVKVFGPVDVQGFAVILAAYLSSQSNGDPLWIFVVAASGMGKTMFLSLLPDRFSVRASTLDKKSLVSGLYADDRADLLAKLPNRCLVMSDMSAFLAKPDDVKKEAFGILRDCYDHQRVVVPFGSVGSKVFESVRFSFLGGVTRAIDAYRDMIGLLGERFLVLRLLEGREAVQHAQKNRGHEAEITKLLAGKVRTFLREREPVCRKQTDTDPIAIDDRLARAIAWARCPVPRDRQHRVLYRPEPEAATRLVKQLGELRKLGSIVMDLAPEHEQVTALIRRVARDTVPADRLDLLEVVNAKMITTSKLAEKLRLPKSTVHEWTEDLWMLKILERGKVDREDLWTIAEPFRETAQELLETPQSTPDTGRIHIMQAAGAIVLTKTRHKPEGPP